MALSRRPEGTVKRQIHRKSTWTGQYTHFHSFVPMNNKRNLVKILVSRACRICSVDSIDAELGNIRQILLQNGYPEKFLDAHTHPPVERIRVPTAERKRVYIRLPYKGESSSLLVRRRMETAIKRTYNAAQLVTLFHSSPVINLQLKDKQPKRATSFCVYSFTCSCGAGYIGHTTRCLSERIGEHMPRWLMSGERRLGSSAILGHILDTGHSVNPDSAFQPIYQVPIMRSRGAKFRVLATAEAVAIRLLSPYLCAQKTHVQALRLPWPAVKRTDNAT